MSKTTKKGMEKIMRFITLLLFGSFLLLTAHACMPIDIESPPFEKENFAPMIRSTTPDVLNGPYNYSDLSSNKLIVKIIDFNTSDTLTLAWYVKDINNQLEVPFKEFAIGPATDNETSSQSIFSFELKESDLVCGLNRVILLVSDRGIKASGLSGEDDYPYPGELDLQQDPENAKKVKVDITEWLIRKECEG